MKTKLIAFFLQKFGIRNKILFVVLASVVLSIGITTIINVVHFSNDLLETTGDRVIQVSVSTEAYTIEKINHQVDLLITISILDTLKNQLREANLKNSQFTEQQMQEKISQIEEVWGSDEKEAISLLQQINGNDMSSYLVQFVSTHSDEAEVFVTDQYGLIYAMSNLTSDYWQADEDWWQQAASGKIYTSNPIFDESSKTWAIIISVPVFDGDPSSEVIGVVRGTVDITPLFNSIFSPDVSGVSYGAFISEDGYIYFETNNRLVVIPVSDSLLEKIRTSSDSTIIEIEDVYGVPAIASKVKLVVRDDTLGWIIVYNHKSNITQIIQTSIIGNVLIGLFLTVILGLIAILFSNSILTALNDLKQDASRLAIGDYSYRFSDRLLSTTDPDISSLVKSIDSMKWAIQSREEKIKAREREYRQLIETMNEGLVVVGVDGMVSYVNPRVCQLLGYSPDEVLGKGFLRFFVEERRKNVIQMWETAEQKNGQIYESKLITSLGKVVSVSISTEPQFDELGKYTGLLAVITDISDRKAFELSLQKKLNEISGLREIDTAILEQATYRGVVNTVMKQFRKHLQADGAAIYIVSPQTNTVDYASAYFLDEVFDQERVGIDYKRLKEFSVLRKGQKTRKVNDQMIVCAHLRGKSLNVHYVAPIIINNVYHGLAEIVYFDDVKLDKEWLNYFNALITQTAVGISKIELIDYLKIRNLELKEAYDGIIKGWAKALELRDEETKGHSDRVFELSIQMANKYHYTGRKLEAFQRGALLHDIGKMGIPDSILLKPGQLTADEWDIMKLHPDLAYVLLSEIPFLKEAIEIPYYHHERCNGSGYPSGLKGEDIPLSARIFAVIDVWDALTSDRPYRKAWNIEKTRVYLIENKGILFDPDVVDQFLMLLEEEGDL